MRGLLAALKSIAPERGAVGVAHLSSRHTLAELALSLSLSLSLSLQCLIRLLEQILKLQQVQRSLVAGNVMMSYLSWLPRQHQTINEAEGGVAGREDMDEEVEKNFDDCYKNVCHFHKNLQFKKFNYSSSSDEYFPFL